MLMECFRRGKGLYTENKYIAGSMSIVYSQHDMTITVYSNRHKKCQRSKHFCGGHAHMHNGNLGVLES
jgi:hypothetical protein